MTDIQQPTPDASAGPGRDARLAQALQHMPDAHMQPGSATRLAVLRAAQEAIAPTAPPQKSGHESGWTRWFKSSAASEHKIPWATAITSVLIVGFVGVLWHDRELPGAIPDGPTMAEKDAVPLLAPAPALQPETTSAVRAEPSPQQSESQLARDKPSAREIVRKEAPTPAFVPPPEVTKAPSTAPVAAVAAAPQPPAAPTASVTPALTAPAPPARIAHDKQSERAVESSDARFDRPRLQTPSNATASSGMVGSLRANKADTPPSEKLLAALRALPCPAPALDSPPNSTTPAWVVEGPLGEIWTITPSTAALSTATPGPTQKLTTPRICAISADQYEQLRQLAH